jgi:hypothetical protein
MHANIAIMAASGKRSRDANRTVNYFGDGSDGDLIVNSNLSFPSVEDGDMIVKQYKSLTINSGIVTTSNRCRGLMIYVQEDCIIDGTLSMTARGCKANPNIGGTDSYTPVAPSDGNPVDNNGLQIPMITNTGTDTLIAANFNGCGNAAVNVVVNHKSIDGNGTIFSVAKESSVDGFGSGGKGGGSYDYGNGADSAGLGRNGVCFSGGAGGGGTQTDDKGLNGVYFGGAGGAGYYNDYRNYGGGGSGNPISQYGSGGSSGTGGLLILIVGGNLTIEGTIHNCGSNGNGGKGGGGGGGSGGGRILILYKNIYTNIGTIITDGGQGGRGDPYSGSSGNSGDITIAQIL